MVAKISSNTSLFGTLLYNKNKIDKDEAELLSLQNVYERADGSFSMQTTIKSFDPYLVANNKTEKPIFHVSINPDPKDNLSDEQYREIADRYMEEMGYQNQPYVVFKHTDIDRIHLHIVSIRVDETGKKLDSNFENMRSMKICRQIEKDYDLHPATKLEQQSYTIPTKPLNYKEGNVKQQVGNIAKIILKSYRFQSIGEYRTLLEKMNVTVEEVKGLNNNLPYQGLLYSALDNEKNKVGTPFKASLFGKDLNLQTLNQHFQKSKQQIEYNKTKEYLKPIIANAIKQAYSKDEFILLLKDKNIEPIFRINDQNRIYGITFIDYNNKTIINGSRLGKEFSANAFDERFKNSSVRNAERIPTEKIVLGMNQSIQSIDSKENRQESGSTSLGLLDFEQHGIDYEAENFAKQKEVEAKKRKRGRGRAW